MQGISAGFRQRRAARTRRRILDASLRVFANMGYEGASMDDIAFELEATKGLLYHHFRSKQAILKGILEEHPLLAAFGSLSEGVRTQSLEGALSSVALRSLRAMRQHRAFVRFLLMQAQSSREQAELVFREVLERWTAVFRSIIEAHLSDGSSRADQLARQIVDVILSSFIRNELGGQPGTDLEGYVLDALDTVVSGVKARNTAHRKVE